MSTNPILELWNAVDSAVDKQFAAEKVVADAQREVAAAQRDVEAAVERMRAFLKELDASDPEKAAKVRAAMVMGD